MDIREEQIEERVVALTSHWPTLRACFACIDCEHLFRLAADHVCPLCGSGSVMEMTRYFNVKGGNPT